MTRSLVGTALAAVIATSFTAVSANAGTELLFSTFFPPQHVLVKDVLKPWADKVAEATHGDVTVSFAASSLAPPPKQLDMVQDGIADVTVQFAGVVPNRLTTLLIGAVPGPTTNTKAMSVALWRTHEAYFEKANEFDRLRLLSLFALPPQMMFGTNGEAISSLEEMKSARIATTPGIAAQAFGAVSSGVVAGPAFRYFELVSKGMVDAFVAVTPIDVVGFNLAPYTKTATDMGDLGTAGTFALVMNEKKWRRLSEENRKAIMSVSGEQFARMLETVDTRNQAIIKQLEADGVKFVTLPDDLRKDLAHAFAPIATDWIASVEAKGVADGAAALKFYRQAQADVAAE
ncbi:TRAP transporter substrate-binding protein DctP [Oceanibacterium hippocampi]|uniref:Bacterial extracellular solute-binding protein, family 7 n=1 Tax=Oceanibacterium hippocampi TaxID=745714 RepID=A0A1Y5TYI7_9PROT|nr:TRAP transporter substrate-binding protein DctP [Oceanibacterium hippocampi]SLN76581.1 Bacterial extracellular solute-binding protein, family 7 [Oceanibacterium hippocampi]